MDFESDYERATRDHYKDAAVASDYHSRLSLRNSPTDWALTRLEIRLVVKALRTLVPESGSTILDIPCGTGKLAPTLWSHGLRVTGADISEQMLSFSPYWDAEVQDATAIDHPDDSFDYAVCLRLLHRVPVEVQDQIVSELTRISRHGVILSYASEPAFELPYRVLHRITRGAKEHSWSLRSRADLHSVVASKGGTIEWDRSVLLGLITERLLVARL